MIFGNIYFKSIIDDSGTGPVSRKTAGQDYGIHGIDVPGAAGILAVLFPKVVVLRYASRLPHAAHNNPGNPGNPVCSGPAWRSRG